MSQFNHYHPAKLARISYGFDRMLNQYFFDIWEYQDADKDWELVHNEGLMTGGCGKSELLEAMIEFGCQPCLIDEVALDLPLGHSREDGDCLKHYMPEITQGWHVPILVPLATGSVFRDEPIASVANIGECVQVCIPTGPDFDRGAEGVDGYGPVENVWCEILDLYREVDEESAAPYLAKNCMRVKVLEAKHADKHGYTTGTDFIVHRRQVFDWESRRELVG